MNDDADMFDAAEEAVNADHARPSAPSCIHCHKPITLHGRFARCSDGQTQFTAACEECGATPCQCDIRRADWERDVYARMKASEEASDAREEAGNTLARGGKADDWLDNDFDA